MTVPVGQCEKCGYPIGSARCPECGVVHAATASAPTPLWMFGIGFAIALLPWVWSFATVGICQILYRLLTSKLTPGDIRYNQAWEKATSWAAPGFYVVLPLTMVILLVWLVCKEYRRSRRWFNIVLLISTALLLGALNWVFSIAYLVLRIWND